MIGSVTPLIVGHPLSEEISIFNFRVTSRSKWTVGFISIFTPTSMYWNWVDHAMLHERQPPTPFENEPVAIGMR